MNTNKSVFDVLSSDNFIIRIGQLFSELDVKIICLVHHRSIIWMKLLEIMNIMTFNCLCLGWLFAIKHDVNITIHYTVKWMHILNHIFILSVLTTDDAQIYLWRCLEVAISFLCKIPVIFPRRKSNITRHDASSVETSAVVWWIAFIS